MIKTYENLAKAFIGESQARNRYTYFAKTAKKEGFEELSEIFLLTAENEKEHAKWLLRMINQLKERFSDLPEEIKVEAEMDTTFSDTKKNLNSAISGEHFETSEMYPEFADIAEEEGFEDIAKRLRAIAVAEKHHEERYKKYLSNIEQGTVFKKEKKVLWVCRKCGYVHEGNEPPEKCPSCDHPKNYFELE